MLVYGGSEFFPWPHTRLTDLEDPAHVLFIALGRGSHLCRGVYTGPVRATEAKS